jgi:hypothetical protein
MISKRLVADTRQSYGFFDSSKLLKLGAEGRVICVPGETAGIFSQYWGLQGHQTGQNVWRSPNEKLRHVCRVSPGGSELAEEICEGVARVMVSGRERERQRPMNAGKLTVTVKAVAMEGGERCL